MKKGSLNSQKSGIPSDEWLVLKRAVTSSSTLLQRPLEFHEGLFFCMCIFFSLEMLCILQNVFFIDGNYSAMQLFPGFNT